MRRLNPSFIEDTIHAEVIVPPQFSIPKYMKSKTLSTFPFDFNITFKVKFYFYQTSL